MKRLMQGVWLAALLMGLAACSRIPVSTDYREGWAPAAGASFAWLPPKEGAPSNPLYDNDLVRARVQGAVNDALQARGLQQAANQAEADLLVAYHVVEEEKIDVDTFHSWYGYYPCWGCYSGFGPAYAHRYGFGYGYPGTDVWVREYTQGTLVIDLVDAESRQLVWRGVAKRRLPHLETPTEREAYIRETVAAILRDFPPGYDAAAATR